MSSIIIYYTGHTNEINKLLIMKLCSQKYYLKGKRVYKAKYKILC